MFARGTESMHGRDILPATGRRPAQPARPSASFALGHERRTPVVKRATTLLRIRIFFRTP